MLRALRAHRRAKFEHRARPQRRRAQVRLEPLEQRDLLAVTFTVNAITDTGAGSGSTGDLRYCITQAEAASDDATIVFDPTVFATPQTITLGATLEINDTAHAIAITGPGATLATIDGAGKVQDFKIDLNTHVQLTGLTIANGASSATPGGGLLNLGATTVSTCTFSGNAAAQGGGIYNAGALALDSDTFTNNSTTTAGGAVGNQGALSILNCVFTSNTATEFGAAVDNENAGVLSVFTSSFSENAVQAATNTSGSGGALSNAAHANTLISGCLFTGNTATMGPIDASGIALQLFLNSTGGAIVNHGTLAVQNTVLSNNEAVVPATAPPTYPNLIAGGGAIYNDVGAILLVSNSTLAGNQAGTGGAIAGAGAWTIRSTTITGNDSGIGIGQQSGTGGGLRTSSIVTASQTSPTPATATLADTLVAGNLHGTAADDVAGTVTGLYSLIGSTSGTTLTAGSSHNVLNVNPLLGPALPDGIYPLQFGSPAINAGSVPLALTVAGLPLKFDGRGPGFPRVFNGMVDIGAFELQGGLATTTTVAAKAPNTFVGTPITLTATVTPVLPTSATSLPGTVQFFLNDAATTPIATAPLKFVGGKFQATVQIPNLAAGTYSQIHANFVGGGGVLGSRSADITVTVSQFSVTGAPKGSQPLIKVVAGTKTYVFYAVNPGFKGGIRVASADVNGDGVPDVITANGPGGLPFIDVIDGTKLNLVGTNGVIIPAALIDYYYAAPAKYTGGLFVTTNTLPNGQVQVISAADPTFKTGRFVKTYQGTSTVTPSVGVGVGKKKLR